MMLKIKLCITEINNILNIYSNRKQFLQIILIFHYMTVLLYFDQILSEHKQWMNHSFKHGFYTWLHNFLSPLCPVM